MHVTVSVALLLALLTAIVLMVFWKRKLARPAVVEPDAVEQLEEKFPKPISRPTDRAQQIVIGSDPETPLVTFTQLPATIEYEKAEPLDTKGNKTVSRLMTLCQAIPSVLVATEASSKQLMEVVINGDLVRAADGHGLRAFSRGLNGIQENARLFEVKNLESMINAAAIWQIASVVVAQKHLADISRKLDEIKTGVSNISLFLDNQRKSRIQATYEYLRQVHVAIQGGDLPEPARHHLEHCERDLLEIQHHLETEYRQKADRQVAHTETYGSKVLTNDIATKISDLDQLVKDMAFCLKTRIAAWHVLSLFPGEPQLKEARRKSILQSLDTFATLAPYSERVLTGEISAISAFWNLEGTLKERKKTLINQCNDTLRGLNDQVKCGAQQIERSKQLLLDHDRPTRLILKYEMGELVGAWVAANQAYTNGAH